MVLPPLTWFFPILYLWNKETIKKVRGIEDTIFTKIDEVHYKQMFYTTDSNLNALLSEHHTSHLLILDNTDNMTKETKGGPSVF